MATPFKNSKGLKAFWRKVRFKYKLSFFNEDSLEEVWSFRLSQLSAFIYIILVIVILVSGTALFIITTPIRNYLPGYLDVEVRQGVYDNALRADSLEQRMAVQALYLDNVMAILTGTMEVDSIRAIDSLALVNPNFEIPRTQEELDFVQSIEEEEKYNLTVLSPHQVPSDVIFFFKPVNGLISDNFAPDKRHYGIDIVAAPKETVLSTLDGTVVFTGFDPNFGNVIQVQHRNGFISIYKHNELLLKKTGDIVTAGEALAIVGNTGELSTGPHLHFELWYRGTPVNPEDYIAF